MLYRQLDVFWASFTLWLHFINHASFSGFNEKENFWVQHEQKQDSNATIQKKERTKESNSRYYWYLMLPQIDYVTSDRSAFDNMWIEISFGIFDARSLISTSSWWPEVFLVPDSTKLHYYMQHLGVYHRSISKKNRWFIKIYSRNT